MCTDRNEYRRISSNSLKSFVRSGFSCTEQLHACLSGKSDCPEIIIIRFSLRVMFRGQIKYLLLHLFLMPWVLLRTDRKTRGISF